MPCTPSLPSPGQRSRGKVLLRSISSARGEILSAAKPRTVSRNMSAVSPRPKSKPLMSLTRIQVVSNGLSLARLQSKVDQRINARPSTRKQYCSLPRDLGGSTAPWEYAISADALIGAPCGVDHHRWRHRRAEAGALRPHPHSPPPHARAPRPL